MDWYFLSVSLTLLFVILLGNVYFLADNAHPKDTHFGSSMVMRLVVVRAPPV